MINVSLLDLSAAFDTVDHDTLLHRLQFTFGVTGKVLSWFSSYLSGRSQQIAINDTLSAEFELRCGTNGLINFITLDLNLFPGSFGKNFIFGFGIGVSNSVLIIYLKNIIFSLNTKTRYIRRGTLGTSRTVVTQLSWRTDLCKITIEIKIKFKAISLSRFFYLHI